nr:putative reverse transcriptase domain-containing protein [Tanacetum cinerariifolium]
KAAILYEYETFKAIDGEQLLDTYLHYLQVINDLKKCGFQKDNCELNYKFLNDLQPEWKQYGDVNDALGYKKKAIVVTSDPLALVAEKTKVSKQKEKVVVSSNSEGSGADDFSELKKITALLARLLIEENCKNTKVKDCNYYKTKMLLAKKDNDKQVLFAEDQAWMESSSDSDQEINANIVFMAQIKKVLSESDESSSSAEETITENADLLAQTEVLKDQLKVKDVVIDTHTECQAQYAKLEEERYEYMIRYSALCDNDKKHRKKIDEQEILFDKMSRQLVEMNNNVLRMCRTPVAWTEVGEGKLLGPEIVQETTDKIVQIKERLKKCLADVNLHVPLDEVNVDDKLRFVEEPMEILDRGVKKLKRRWIAIVKVRWNS